MALAARKDEKAKRRRWDRGKLSNGRKDQEQSLGEARTMVWYIYDTELQQCMARMSKVE